MILPQKSQSVAEELEESFREINISTDSSDSSDSSSDDVISILDRRNDGANCVYYYVRKRSSPDDIYVWELENKLSCSKGMIEEFNTVFQQKQKLRKNRALEFAKKKKKITERFLPCACINDSPIDLNRSFRGSICDR